MPAAPKQVLFMPVFTPIKRIFLEIKRIFPAFWLSAWNNAGAENDTLHLSGRGSHDPQSKGEQQSALKHIKNGQELYRPQNVRRIEKGEKDRPARMVRYVQDLSAHLPQAHRLPQGLPDGDARRRPHLRPFHLGIQA